MTNDEIRMKSEARNPKERGQPYVFSFGSRESGVQTIVARASRSCVGCTARTGGTPVQNANGVLKQSPRLAHSAYLGSRVGTRCQPQRGCVPPPRSTSCARNQMTNDDRHV